jgi:hypothetical protein
MHKKFTNSPKKLLPTENPLKSRSRKKPTERWCPQACDGIPAGSRVKAAAIGVQLRILEMQNTRRVTHLVPHPGLFPAVLVSSTVVT